MKTTCTIFTKTFLETPYCNTSLQRPARAGAKEKILNVVNHVFYSRFDLLAVRACIYDMLDKKTQTKLNFVLMVLLILLCLN